jgi:hypothetical protein
MHQNATGDATGNESIFDVARQAFPAPAADKKEKLPVAGKVDNAFERHCQTIFLRR